MVAPRQRTRSVGGSSSSRRTRRRRALAWRRDRLLGRAERPSSSSPSSAAIPTRRRRPAAGTDAAASRRRASRLVRAREEDVARARSSARRRCGSRSGASTTSATGRGGCARRAVAGAADGADLALLPGFPAHHPDHDWLVRSSPRTARRADGSLRRAAVRARGRAAGAPVGRRLDGRARSSSRFARSFRDRLAKWRAIRAVPLAAPAARWAGACGAGRTARRAPEWVAWSGAGPSLHGGMKLVMTLLRPRRGRHRRRSDRVPPRCRRRLRRRDRQPLRGRDHGDPRALRARGRAPPDPRARRRPAPERVGHADGAARRDRLRRGLGPQRRCRRVLVARRRLKELLDAVPGALRRGARRLAQLRAAARRRAVLRRADDRAALHPELPSAPAQHALQVRAPRSAGHPHRPRQPRGARGRPRRAARLVPDRDPPLPGPLLEHCRRKYVTQFVALERNAEKGIPGHMADAYAGLPRGPLDDVLRAARRGRRGARGGARGRHVRDRYPAPRHARRARLRRRDAPAGSRIRRARRRGRGASSRPSTPALGEADLGAFYGARIDDLERGSAGSNGARRPRPPPRGSRVREELLRRLLAFVPTRAALVLFALALAVFWFQALGWPMAKGRTPGTTSSTTSSSSTPTRRSRGSSSSARPSRRSSSGCRWTSAGRSCSRSSSGCSSPSRSLRGARRRSPSGGSPRSRRRCSCSSIPPGPRSTTRPRATPSSRPGLALWALILARTLRRPSTRGFAALGLGLAVLVLIRPANQVLLPAVLVPLLAAAVPWRRRLTWVGGLLRGRGLPLAAWAVHNGVRYDDPTVTRGGRAWVPFLRVFLADGTIAPENGQRRGGSADSSRTRCSPRSRSQASTSRSTPTSRTGRTTRPSG